MPARRRRRDRGAATAPAPAEALGSVPAPDDGGVAAAERGADGGGTALALTLARRLAEGAAARRAAAGVAADAAAVPEAVAPASAHDADADAEADATLRLIAGLSADPEAADAFLPALGAELRARGLSLSQADVERALATSAVAPLLGALAAALDAADSAGAESDAGAGAIDFERAMHALDDGLRGVLGASPRELRERADEARTRADAAAQVAASMRAHGLVALEDAAAGVGGDPFWDLVDLGRLDPPAFRRSLETLPETALVDFHWAHVAAVAELRRAWQRQHGGADDRATAGAADTSPARAAAFVARGYEAHARAVETATAGAATDDPAGQDAPPPRDLGGDAARALRERFGRPPG